MTDRPTDWNSRRKSIYRRDDYTCQNCGRVGGDSGDAQLHAHHVVPIKDGGSHRCSNLQTLCKRCHNAIHHEATLAPTAAGSPTSSGRPVGAITSHRNAIAYLLLTLPIFGSVLSVGIGLVFFLVSGSVPLVFALLIGFGLAAVISLKMYSLWKAGFFADGPDSD